MADFIRELVSKKKKREVVEINGRKYNLDLTYIGGK